MSLRPRKKEEPSHPIGSLYSNAITLKPGVLVEPGPAARLKPSDTDMRISTDGYFVVEVQKGPIKSMPGDYIEEEFDGQEAVRVTTSLIYSRGDRIAFTKGIGVKLGNALPANMFKDAVPFNGYYCANPELSIYSITYPAKATGYDATAVPVASELVKKLFRDEGVEPNTDFKLTGLVAAGSDTYTYKRDETSAELPTYFKVKVFKK